MGSILYMGLFVGAYYAFLLCQAIPSSVAVSRGAGQYSYQDPNGKAGPNSSALWAFIVAGRLHPGILPIPY